MRGDFNTSSFCEMMSSAHACSSAMAAFPAFPLKTSGNLKRKDGGLGTFS